MKLSSVGNSCLDLGQGPCKDLPRLCKYLAINFNPFGAAFIIKVKDLSD